MMPMNVLVTAASRRVALIQAFQAAIDTLGLPGRVIATDVNAYSPAVHVADRAYAVPLAIDPGYIEALLDICRAERIRLVVPTIDDELTAVGEARERFRQVGAFAACSSAATAAACNDKYETCTRLAAHGIPAALTYLPHELPASPVFPMFIKPRVGRGAVGAHVLQDARDMAYFLDQSGLNERGDSHNQIIDALHPEEAEVLLEVGVGDVTRLTTEGIHTLGA